MRKRLGDFDQQIRRYRKLKGWIQERLAEEVDITPNYLGMIERGERTPGFWLFVTLVVKWHFLITGDDAVTAN